MQSAFMKGLLIGMFLNNDQKTVIKMLSDHYEALSDRRRFVSLLSDCLPENKALRVAVTCAFDERLFEDFRDGSDSKQTIFRGRRKLENCGIASNYAYVAIEIVAFITGKEEWLDEEGVLNKERFVQTYDAGRIEYIKSRDGILITDVEFVLDSIKKQDSMIVIPEQITNIDVVGILPDALNRIRKSRFKKILLPHTLRFVGEKGKSLYVGFHEKGSFAKPLLYYCTCPYTECISLKSLLDSSAEDEYEEFWGTEIESQKLSSINHVIALKKNQDSDDYWNYPKDGLWIEDRTLIMYTGNSEVINVQRCNRISSDVFINISAKEIIFGNTVTEFASNAIYDCKDLSRIVFKAESSCKFSQSVIHHCNNLSEIIWPSDMESVKWSIYDHCEKMGNMIMNQVLFTCQEKSEIYRVDESIRSINQEAFVSCEDLKILVIPETVDSVNSKAFDKTRIEAVIFSGVDTVWETDGHIDGLLYVFCHENARIVKSINPYQIPKKVIFKNIARLSPCKDFCNLEELVSLCKDSMDDESDYEMLPNLYDWNTNYEEASMWEELDERRTSQNSVLNTDDGADEDILL